MRIRLSSKEDLDHLVQIWLECSIKAHHFIDQDYWKSMMIEMKQKYLPLSKTYIIEQGKDIVGFVSMVDNYFNCSAMEAEREHHKRKPRRICGV
jgi:putative acetyltransferase